MISGEAVEGAQTANLPAWPRRSQTLRRQISPSHKSNGPNNPCLSKLLSSLNNQPLFANYHVNNN